VLAFLARFLNINLNVRDVWDLAEVVEPVGAFKLTFAPTSMPISLTADRSPQRAKARNT